MTWKNINNYCIVERFIKKNVGVFYDAIVPYDSCGVNLWSRHMCIMDVW